MSVRVGRRASCMNLFWPQFRRGRPHDPARLNQVEQDLRALFNGHRAPPRKLPGQRLRIASLEVGPNGAGGSRHGDILQRLQHQPGPFLRSRFNFRFVFLLPGAWVLKLWSSNPFAEAMVRSSPTVRGA